MSPWTFQEPPYDGPYDREVFDPNVYATLAGGENETHVIWCKPCMRLVPVDNRPGFRHPHFQFDDQGALVL